MTLKWQIFQIHFKILKVFLKIEDGKKFFRGKQFSQVLKSETYGKVFFMKKSRAFRNGKYQNCVKFFGPIFFLLRKIS